MASTELHFATADGHSAVVKPVLKKGGVMEGKWFCKIQGPKVAGKSGIKTVYCAPNEEAAKQSIANFLRVSPTNVYTTTANAIPVVTPPSQRQREDVGSILEARSGLREALRQVRLEFAHAKDLPAYCIFDDKTLDALVVECPVTDRELLAVKGFGPTKVRDYGAAIIRVIRKDRRASLNEAIELRQV